MAAITKTNPYTPGFGLEPAYLAGRKEECQVITSTLARLNEPKDADGALLKSPYGPTVMIGPRGVGKTVLLYYAQVQAQKLGISYVEISKSILEDDPSEILELIDPDTFIQRTTSKLTSVKLGPVSVAAEGGFDLSKTRKNINLALRSRMSKGPLLLIMDEVHTYERDFLRPLLIVIQELLKNKFPLAVIMAGTPGLSKLLHSCGASFVERSERVRMNLLDQEATKLALAEPAKQSGLPLASDALEELVASSDCYPYFIQLLGRDAWQLAREAGHKKITLADAQQGIAKAQEQRDGFYDDRFSELIDLNLENHAFHIIDWMRKADNAINFLQLVDNFVQLDKLEIEVAKKIINDLIDIGFVWKVRNTLYSGIPSLFNYIEDTR